MAIGVRPEKKQRRGSRAAELKKIFNASKGGGPKKKVTLARVNLPPVKEDVT